MTMAKRNQHSNPLSGKKHDRFWEAPHSPRHGKRGKGDKLTNHERMLKGKKAQRRKLGLFH
jgi:hypothetical protein